MARPKSTSKLVSLKKIYPQEVCNGIDQLTSMHLIPDETTPAKLGIVEQICDAWAIAAFWVAYDMMLIVDIGRPPYVFKNFQQYRSWAKVLYAHQRLCFGCKEHGRSSHINVPFWRWIACMEEVKLGHFIEALSPPGPYSQGLICPPSGGESSSAAVSRHAVLGTLAI